jgi:hypothetical protein
MAVLPFGAGGDIRVPTKKFLWDRMKKKHRATDNGSPPGRWSVEKAVAAQLEYEREGGSWTRGGGNTGASRVRTRKG